jgi:hypothetical protein
MTNPYKISWALFLGITLLFINPLNIMAAEDDGLEQIEGRFQALYWAPGKTLEQYKRIVMLDCFVQFRNGWLADESRGKLSNEQVTEVDMMDISETLSAQFNEVFTEVLSEDDGFDFVTAAEHDVLVLRPAIVNLDIGLGVYNSRASNDISPVKMTLYLEFFDSMSGLQLGRALEIRAEPESNRATVGRIIRRWAEATRETIKHGPRT